MKDSAIIDIEPQVLWLRETAAQLRHVLKHGADATSLLAALAEDMDARADAIIGTVPARDLRGACLYAAATVFRQSALTLLSTVRTKNVVRARHCAWHAAKEIEPTLTLCELGRMFNRDHATVIHAFSKPRDPALPEVVELARRATMEAA